MFRKAAEQDNGNGHWLLARSETPASSLLLSLTSPLRMLIEGKGRHLSSRSQQQDYLEGFLHASKAADSHHIPQAQHLMGVIFEYGIGIQQDLTKAVSYYRRAAEQRYVESMYHLALMYVYGRGTEIQHSRGLSLFEVGCAANHAPSCHYMGIMKTYGYGTAVDYREAALWFEKSGSLDDERISKESASYSALLTDLLQEAEEHNNRVVDQFMKRQELYEDL
jgi:TPR repeat protein